MSLSKRAKRGISAFNRARNPLYSAQRISFNPQLDSYIKAYEEFLNGKTISQSGEMVGPTLSSEGDGNGGTV